MAGGIVLEEKWEDILEQYDLKVKRILWARGAKLLETDQGLFQLKQFTGKPRQLALEYVVTSGLARNGYQLLDSILETKDGALYSLGTLKKYGRKAGAVQGENGKTQEEEQKIEDMLEKEWWEQPFPEDRDIYVIRRWFSGEEGNFRNMEFLKKAASALGTLHNAFESLEIPEKLVMLHPSMMLLENWQRHNRELKKIRRYILNKKQKNEFEILFLSMETGYLESAEEACQQLEKGSCKQLFLEAKEKKLLCHGNYNYHNLLDTKMGLATVCFEDTGIGIPLFDLYQMMRKLLEKNRWDKGLAIDVLKEYEEKRALNHEEKKLLYIMLLYPEKFWKVSNHYYNSRKSWINKIDIAKLQELGKQQKKREETLEYLKNY